MENRFTIKDFFLFILLVAVIVMVGLGMKQFDRQYDKVLEIERQASLTARDVQALSERIEGLNARNLTAADIGGPFSFVVSDVSFISLKLALAPALALAEPGARAVLLVKPQFEAGRDAIGKAGLLKDPSSAPAVAAELERWFSEDIGWQSLGLIASPITGGDGNQEFLLAGIKP